MLKIILVIVMIASAFTSCKTPNNAASVTKDAVVKPGDQPRTVCYGDRKFLSGDEYGFDFQATHSQFGNVYWSAIASNAAYGNGAENQMLISDWGKTALKKFEFYGEEIKSKGTEGYFAEFDQGIFLALRGTASRGDIMTDLNRTKFRGKAFNREGVLEELLIHKGFWDAGSYVWEPILKNIMNSAPIIDLAVTSPEAFRQTNLVFRSIIQEADIENYRPNDHFLPELKLLQQRSVLKPSADMGALLGVLNIWAEESLLASKAYAAGVKSGNMTYYDAVAAKGLVRKQKNFSRVQPFFNYRAYKPIWLTGHSMGAAVATVLAYRLLKSGIPVQGLITFGSPRVGNDVFEYFFESAFKEDGRHYNMMRFQNDNDGVTRVPHINGWRHVGDPWFITSDKKLMVHQPPPGEQSELTRALSRYPVITSVVYYPGELPPGYRGIWTFDLLKFVADHDIVGQYLSQVEQYAFGKKAAGCP